MEQRLIKKQYPKVAGFFTHGVKSGRLNGFELEATCLFCGSDKFSINVNKGTWNCWKGCGGGSYFDFLKKIAIDFKLPKDSTKLKELSIHKHIPVDVLFKYNVGLNEKTGEYLIPEYNKTDISDLKRYKFTEVDGKIEKYFYSSPSTKKHYFSNGVDSDCVIICEGEWDLFVLDTIFPDYTIVCIPGAVCYKSEWNSLFRNKNVIVMFDNDRHKFHNGKLVLGAAEQGYIKIYNELQYLVEGIAFLNWEKTLKGGYDIRDLWIDCNENQVQVEEYIMNNLIEKPKHYNKERCEKKHEVSYKTLYNTLDKWLEIPDKSGVDAIYATIFANKMDSDPLWLMYVARSGFTKSEIIQTLKDAKNTYHTSSISPASLAYGGHKKDGKDPSLIPQWDGKTVIIKDLTTMLNSDPQNVANVFGILRDAYDGNTQRNTAQNVASFKSKFGIICGVTPVIYSYAEGNTQYGERFLYYRANDDLGLFEELGIIQAAAGNTNKESKMRDELQNIGKLIAERSITQIPTINKDMETRIAYTAMWLSIFRGSINRNKYRNNEVMGKALMEIGTRVVKQLKSFVLGLCLFKGKLEAEEVDFNLMLKVAISSASDRYMPVFKYMLKKGLENKFSFGELAANTTYVEKISERIVEDLCILKVLKQTSKGMQKTDSTYIVTNKIKIISRSVFK